MKKVLFTFAIAGFLSYGSVHACGGHSKASAEKETTENVEASVEKTAETETVRACCASRKAAAEKGKNCSSKSSKVAKAESKSSDE